MNYSNLYTAYAKYLTTHYEHVSDLTKQLQLDAWSEPDSIVWKWLEMTGDREYTNVTFMKVAEKLLKEAK